MTSDATIELFIGMYGDGEQGGLIPLTRGATGDDWRLGDPDLSIRNASYAVFSPRHDLYFIVDEREDGHLGAYRRQDGRWTQLRYLSSEGAGPCFVTLNDDETALAVANYDSGSVAWFDIGEDGQLSGPRLVHRNAGGGPDPERQEAPHAHCVRFHGHLLYSTDLGTDEILMHTADEKSETVVAARIAGGEGPRHILFHPSKALAYVLTEMGSRLFTFAVQGDGQLTQINDVSTLALGNATKSIAAHLEISADATRIYVSNRGDDSLAVFDLATDGIPQFVDCSPTGAADPRHFRLLEEQARVVVAHQKGGRVTVLELDGRGRPGSVIWSAAAPKAAFVGALLPD